MPVNAAADAKSRRRDQSLAKALSNMEEALHLLDEGRAPEDIGAHLDLAVQRLRETIGRDGA